MESFDIKIKKIKNPKQLDYLTDEESDEGSVISECDEYNDSDCSETTELLLEYLKTAFSDTATVSNRGFGEFDLFFYDQNVELIEDDEEYDFEVIDDIPRLTDARYFIPFVNFLKISEPSLTGCELLTNLEGGGTLVI